MVKGSHIAEVLVTPLTVVFLFLVNENDVYDVRRTQLFRYNDTTVGHQSFLYHLGLVYSQSRNAENSAP